MARMSSPSPALRREVLPPARSERAQSFRDLALLVAITGALLSVTIFAIVMHGATPAPLPSPSPLELEPPPCVLHVSSLVVQRGASIDLGSCALLVDGMVTLDGTITSRSGE